MRAAWSRSCRSRALASGDLRCLYLGWLRAVQQYEVEDDEPEPPMPPGLGKLSGPLKDLAEFLWLEDDLLAVAVEASTGSAPAKPRAGGTASLGRRPAGEDKDAWLLELLGENAGRTRAEVLRHFREAETRKRGPTPQGAGTGRTAGQLRKATECSTRPGSRPSKRNWPGPKRSETAGPRPSGPNT